MRALRFVAGALLVPLAAASIAAQGTYFPPAGSWEKRTPAQVGLLQSSVDSAVKIAIAAESTTPKDLLQNHVASSFGREPHSEAVGPFTVRGSASGLIIRRGYIVAEWGDVDRPENTYSVTKSFVSTTIGLAFDRKMIRNLNDPVRLYMPPVVALKDQGYGVRRIRPAPALRVRTQSQDYVGSPAPADERLAGHPVGEAGLGGSPAGRRGTMEDAEAQRAGHSLHLQ
jgi:CubicO group peptidase (beta-lactamase class C family)